MSSSDYRDTVHVRYTHDGITGVGEGAPIVRYHENAESAERAIESVRGMLAAADPYQFGKVMAAVFHRIDGQYAAKAAIDIALMDWFGKKLGIPLFTYFGLDRADAPLTRARAARLAAPVRRVTPGPSRAGLQRPGS